MKMFKVRVNVGIQGWRRGSVVQMSEDSYNRYKAFVTVLEGPAPIKETLPPVEAKKVEEHGLLWKERGDVIERDESSDDGSADTEPNAEEDSSA